jgi:hypothetical protein
MIIPCRQTTCAASNDMKLLLKLRIVKTGRPEVGMVACRKFLQIVKAGIMKEQIFCVIYSFFSEPNKNYLSSENYNDY